MVCRTLGPDWSKARFSVSTALHTMVPSHSAFTAKLYQRDQICFLGGSARHICRPVICALAVFQVRQLRSNHAALAFVQAPAPKGVSANSRTCALHHFAVEDSAKVAGARETSRADGT